MRQPYLCVCDFCHQKIEFANDENDIKLNGLVLEACPQCHNDLMIFVELAQQGNGKLREMVSLVYKGVRSTSTITNYRT